MNKHDNSRKRFGEFIDRFKDGDLGRHRDEKDKKDGADNKPLNRRESFAVYFRYLKPHWRMVSLITGLAIVCAILEVIQPLFGRYIIDSILLADHPLPKKMWMMNVVGGSFFLVVVAVRLLDMWRSWSQRLLNNRVILGLRRALFARLLKLPLEKLSDMKVGGIISRLTDDISKTTGLLQMAVISPSIAVLRLVLAMGILIFINWKLAVAALGIIPPIMILSMVAIRRIRPIYRAIRKDVSHVDGRVGEAFQGIRDVRAFGGEHMEETAYTVGHHTITRMRMFAAKREIILWSIWGALMGLIGVLITWLGGFWFLRDQATIGDIMAFQFYVFMLLNPVWQIVESLTELQRSLAATERVFEVLESPIDKPDRDDAVAARHRVDEIRFKNVSFAYEPDRNVISDFDLTVPGGSVVALVGRSGAGKTTITDLVARFYDPTGGRITLNGRDLREYRLESYRDLIGLVQQETFLFDGTVFENIAYANRNASYEQVVAAAQQANAHSFVIELEKGYESLIGERGVKLSGGQRQRLSIARSLLADPAILILDEATSNLDTESEQLIQGAMTELLRDRTTFVIAHRLSTITHADQIVVIDDGRIIETGTHSELIERDGHYADMIRRQHESVTI